MRPFALGEVETAASGLAQGVIGSTKDTALSR
jgi:hypothetical protein